MTHFLALLYILGHTTLLVFGKAEAPGFALHLNLGLAFYMALVAWLGFDWSASGLWRTVFLWSPIVFFWWAYTWAGHTLLSVHPPDYTWDAWIIDLEDRYLGQPALWWARRGNRFISEILHFCYTSYYLYTPVLGIYLQTQQRFVEFQAMAFAVLFGYLVSYLCFAVTPAWGPRWALVSAGRMEVREQHPEGYAMTAFIGRIMYNGPAHKGGALPSSHSSTALVFLLWGWRLWDWPGGVICTALAVGMWLGSIYGRYHYVLDILLGALLGLAGYLLAEWLVL